MRVNNCLPYELINVYFGVSKQGGVYNTPCLPRVSTLPRVFTLMNGQGGQSVHFLENNAFSNASQLQGVKELGMKAEVMQTADRVKYKRLEVRQ